MALRAEVHHRGEMLSFRWNYSKPVSRRRLVSKRPMSQVASVNGDTGPEFDIDLSPPHDMKTAIYRSTRDVFTTQCLDEVLIQQVSSSL